MALEEGVRLPTSPESEEQESPPSATWLGLRDSPKGLLPEPGVVLTKAYREWAPCTKPAHWGCGRVLSHTHKAAWGLAWFCLFEMRSLGQDTTFCASYKDRNRFLPGWPSGLP